MIRRTDSGDTPLNERILDLLVYVPAGIVVSVAEELPKLAARGRDRLGVRVSSARAVGPVRGQGRAPTSSAGGR